MIGGTVPVIPPVLPSVNEVLSRFDQKLPLTVPAPTFPPSQPNFCDFDCSLTRSIGILEKTQKFWTAAELVTNPTVGLVDAIGESTVSNKQALLGAKLGKLVEIVLPEDLGIGNVPGALVSTLGTLNLATQVALERLKAADPPDLNFKEVVQPRFGLVPAPALSFGTMAMTSAFQMAVTLEDRYRADTEAVVTTINRYGSAKDAGDTASAILQLNALEKYLQAYADSRVSLNVALLGLEGALARGGFPDVSVGPDTIRALQDRVRANGLPPDVLLDLSLLGFSDAVQAGAQDIFLSLNASDFASGTLFDTLTEESSAFADPTPEPTTLLLWGTSMAGLGLAARWKRRRQN